MKKTWFTSCAAVFLFFICSVIYSFSAKQYYDYGRSLMDKGDYNNAYKYLAAAAKADPKNPDYYRAIGDCYEGLGKDTMAQKYYAYADRLGAGSQSAGAGGRANEMKLEVIMFSGGTSSSGTATYVPVFAAGFERSFSRDLSLAGTFGYVYGGSASQNDGMGDTMSLDGSGFMVQAKLNWHLDKMFKGLYAGPDLAYMPISYVFKETMTDEYDGTVTTDTAKLNVTYIMGGAHVGYRYPFDNGFVLEGFVYLDLATETVSGDQNFGGMKMSASGFLQFYGVSLGYGF